VHVSVQRNVENTHVLHPVCPTYIYQHPKYIDIHTMYVQFSSKAKTEAEKLSEGTYRHFRNNGGVGDSCYKIQSKGEIFCFSISCRSELETVRSR